MKLVLQIILFLFSLRILYEGLKGVIFGKMQLALQSYDTTMLKNYLFPKRDNYNINGLKARLMGLSYILVALLFLVIIYESLNLY